MQHAAQASTVCCNCDCQKGHPSSTNVVPLARLSKHSTPSAALLTHQPANVPFSGVKKPALALPVCRAYCSAPQQGINADEEKAIWIPGRLLAAATRDPELYSFILDSALRQGLFPARLAAKAAAQHWGMVFMTCSEQERSAIQAVLKAKSKLQQDVQSFLTVRGEPSGPSCKTSGHKPLSCFVRVVFFASF